MAAARKNFPYAIHPVVAMVRQWIALARAKAPVSKRLVATGGAGTKDRIARRVAIASPADVDAQVVRWIATACALDA